MLKSMTRLLLIGVVFAVFYEGVSYAIAISADGEGANTARWLLLEIRRSEALQQRAIEIAQSTELKRNITDELLAGHLTLREAVDQFRAANALVEGNHDGLIPSYHLPISEAGQCRQVLAWTKSLLRERCSSEEAESILHRLEKELEEQFPSTERFN